MTYRAQDGFVNLDFARQSRIDPQEAAETREGPVDLRSEEQVSAGEPARRDHSSMGKGDEKGRFCKVAASPNSHNLTERGITLIEKLLAMPGRGVKTFDAFQRLDQTLGSPHRSFRSVHVGGTNGKGSVATKIAEGLRAEGFRVGLYTSPHISSMSERIRIDGEVIAEKEIICHLSALFRLQSETYSFFDLMTALAFLHFRKEQVDWAVVEVGLGGRLDATNVIQPEISVITSIGYDHMEILGDTLEKIAREKAGIVKTGIPFIAGPSAAPFFPHAEAVPPVSGFYDAENCMVAAAAMRRLGLSEKSIEAGIRARPACRFEIIGDTVLDAAHNAQGFARLAEALRIHFPKEKFHFLVAFSKDKQWQACLDLIRPLAAKISFINTHPRFVPLGGGSLQEAIRSVDAREVICGSFYLMDEARRLLNLLNGSRAGSASGAY